MFYYSTYVKYIIKCNIMYILIMRNIILGILITNLIKI